MTWVRGGGVPAGFFTDRGGATHGAMQQSADLHQYSAKFFNALNILKVSCLVKKLPIG
jgi:hypothetical protein